MSRVQSVLDVLARLSPLALMAVVVGVLAGAATGWPPLSWLAWGGLLFYLIEAARHLGFKGRAFLLLSGSMALAAELRLPSGEAEAVLGTALDRATFITTLYVALGFLREAAETSPMIRRCGQFLAAQPPGRRYIALTSGGQVFGIILNFGVIPLLGSMVVQAVKGDDTWRGRLRLRRMMSAVQRGFCATLTWSPLTVSLAVVMTALPSTPWSAMAPWGLGTAALFLVLGWAFDRLIRPPQGTTPSPMAPMAGGRWSMLLPVVALVAGVFALGAWWQAVAGVSLVVGVLTTTPFVAAGWLLLQYRATTPALGAATTATARRLVDHGKRAFPALRMELVLLSSAAFVGSVIAALLPPEVVRDALNALPLPSWAWLPALAVFIVGVGQIGLNPVLSITILTGALPAPEVLGLSPVAYAVTLTGAWALASASSPFSAAPLVTGQMAGVSASTVGRRWNGPYVIACLIALGVWSWCVSLWA